MKTQGISDDVVTAVAAESGSNSLSSQERKLDFLRQQESLNFYWNWNRNWGLGIDITILVCSYACVSVTSLVGIFT